MNTKPAKNSSTKPIEAGIASAVRSAMPRTAGFQALAKTLGVPVEALTLACEAHHVLVVGSDVLKPFGTLLTHKDMAGNEVWPMDCERPTGGADMVDFATELHSATVEAMADTGVDMSVLVIRAADEDGNDCFWNIHDGWVDSPQESTLFYGYEVPTLKLPGSLAGTPTEWKPFVAAFEAHENQNPDAETDCG